MSLLRTSRILSSARGQLQIVPRLTAPSIQQQQRQISSTPARKGGDAHGDPYDPPTGWLFGVKPGEKAEKEGWENVFYYGFFGSIAFWHCWLLVQAGHQVGLLLEKTGPRLRAFRAGSDYSRSIQTWALEEARRRLEVEGILEDPEKKQ